MNRESLLDSGDLGEHARRVRHVLDGGRHRVWTQPSYPARDELERMLHRLDVHTKLRQRRLGASETTATLITSKFL